NLFREVHVEAPEINQLTGRIDLGLIGGLALPEHRRRIYDRPPRPSQQIRGLEEHRRAILEAPIGPLAPRLLRLANGTLHPGGAGLMHLGKYPLVRVGTDAINGAPGANLFAADYDRDVDRLVGHLLERGLQAGTLRRAGRIAQHRLVEWTGDIDCTAHRLKPETGGRGD